MVMLDAVSSSLTGLNNATQRLVKAAANISNASAFDVTKSAAENTAAPVNVDEELVNSKLASINYTANAKVLKAELDNEKKLLDILA